jgi:hypothetical protein
MHTGPGSKKHDLSGQAVLIARQFVYLGRSAPRLPKRFADLIPGRGHKCKFDLELVENFVAFIEAEAHGFRGLPAMWEPVKVACGTPTR